MTFAFLPVLHNDLIPGGGGGGGVVNPLGFVRISVLHLLHAERALVADDLGRALS